MDLCEALGWLDPARIATPELPDHAQLERFHAAHYLDALAEIDRTGLATPSMRQHYNLGTLECPVFPGLWERARMAVGGSMLAARLALNGVVAFHPTGGTHHGRPDRASGFCYLNDPVFAILALLDAGIQRVLYVDLDAHHGDGVEAAYAEDPRVRFVSIHEDGRWPGSGRCDETLGGRALNVPVPRGIGDGGYRKVLDELVAPFAVTWAPEAVVVVLGADGLAGDPLSGMALSNRMLWSATLGCVALATRAVVLGGGGYNPWTTARLWAGLWGLLSGHELPDSLPPAAQDVLARLDCDLVEPEDRLAHWTTTIVDPPGADAHEPHIDGLVAVIARHHAQTACD